MEKKHYYTGLILKQLAGEISPTEQRVLEDWLTEDEAHRSLFEDLRASWRTSAAEATQAEAAYRRMADRLDFSAQPTPRPRKIRRVGAVSWRVAATLTGLLVLAAITYYLLFAPDMVQYKTAYGETTRLVLPDSSVVVLNANSSLTYSAQDSWLASREVWLDGEAFFQVNEIARASSPPSLVRFVVHTPQVDVEVVGTQFNVNERRGRTAVVLNSGQVKLSSRLNSEQALMMQPGEYVEVSEAHPQFNKKLVRPENYSTWREKKLVMDNTPLREVALTTEDYFGLNVVIEAGLANKTLTGSIPLDDLETFLTVLSASVDMRVQQEGSTLLFKTKEEP